MRRNEEAGLELRIRHYCQWPWTHFSSFLSLSLPTSKMGTINTLCRRGAIEIQWDNKTLHVKYLTICFVQLRYSVNVGSLSPASKGWTKHCAHFSLSKEMSHSTAQELLDPPWFLSGPKVTLSYGCVGRWWWKGGVRDIVCPCVRCVVHPNLESESPETSLWLFN